MYSFCQSALDSILLLQAIVLLDSVQQKRKVSAGLRMSAVALFSILGAPLLANEELAALHVKHIQHDTISGESNSY